MWQGSMAALVTPMSASGEIDYASFSSLVQWHIEQKTDALVILGTTGESPTIDWNERDEIIRFVMKEVGGRVPVIAGTGANSTNTAIELTDHAASLGVDGALVVTPYYNSPTQRGLFHHYAAVATSVDVPIIMYNVPSRTGVDLAIDTTEQLAGFDNIVGLKDATGEIDRVLYLADSDLSLYSGDDASCAEFVLNGGRGVISVAANVVPGKMHELMQAALRGDQPTTAQLNDQLKAIFGALFIETNPIPVKWVLAHMGKIKSGIRLPLTPMSANCVDAVKEALVASEAIC